MSNIINYNPYPVDTFPTDLRDAIKEVLGIVQTTDVIAATSVLGTLSTAIGPNVDWVHPATGQIRPCTLYLLVVALSGERKSTTDALVAKPLYDFDEQALTRYEEQMSSFTTSTPSRDAQAVTKQNKPKLTRIIRQDISHRAVAEALKGDGRSISLMTDEGQILLASNVMKNLGALNTYWDGKRIQPYDRGKGDVIVVRSPRVTLNVMVQPAVMEEFMAKHAKLTHGSGHFARYLLARSPTIQGFRRQTHGASSLTHLPVFHQRITCFLDSYRTKVDAGCVYRDVLEFDEAAKRNWFDIAERVEQDIKPGYFLSDIADFGSKYMEIVSRIACLLHYYLADTNELPDETAEARSQRIGKISVQTLASAQQIAAWHLHEYKSLFSPQLMRPQHEHDADYLCSFLHRKYFQAGKFEGMKNFIGQTCGMDRKRYKLAVEVLSYRGAIFVTSQRVDGSKKPTDFITINSQYFQNLPI